MTTSVNVKKSVTDYQTHVENAIGGLLHLRASTYPNPSQITKIKETWNSLNTAALQMFATASLEKELTNCIALIATLPAAERPALVQLVKQTNAIFNEAFQSNQLEIVKNLTGATQILGSTNFPILQPVKPKPVPQPYMATKAVKWLAKSFCNHAGKIGLTASVGAVAIAQPALVNTAMTTAMAGAKALAGHAIHFGGIAVAAGISALEESALTTASSLGQTAAIGQMALIAIAGTAALIGASKLAAYAFRRG